MTCRWCFPWAAALLLGLPAAAQVHPVFPGLHLPLFSPLFSFDDDYVVADIDLDGELDLLGSTGGGSGPFLHIARGLPQGGFAPLVSYPLVGSTKLCLAVGALDGDGWPDVALGDGQERVVVAHNAGGGVFGFSAAYYVGHGDPWQVAIADLDHDGTGDLLSATDSTPGWLNVNFADGTGGYLGSLSVSPGIEITDMETGNLDADGWLDVMGCDHAGDDLAVMLGDGVGGLLPAQVLATPDGPREILVGPLDGDADLDLLLVSTGSSTVASGEVCTWHGDGAGALAPGLGLLLPGYPFAGELHDFEADGDLDVLVVTGSQVAQILLNDGSGTWELGVATTLASGGPPELLDVTADGVPDLLVHGLQDLAALHPALPDGSFPASDRWLVKDGQIRAITVARVDFDDIPDVVFTGWDDASLGTLRGAPGGLQLPALISSGYDQGFDVVVGDVDGDTLADVVTSAFGPPRLQVGHGNGAGAFLPPKSSTWTTPASTPEQLGLADLDGDGWLDVVGAITDDVDSLVTLRNLGATTPGAFAEPVVYDAGKYPSDQELGDFDGDGATDVLLITTGEFQLDDSVLQTFLGDGAGGLAAGPATGFPGATYDVVGLAVADFDLDGRLDAAVGQPYDQPITIAYGDGAGGFVPGPWLPNEWSTELMVAGDVDGDGWPDLLHSGHDASQTRLNLRLGDGAGSVLEPETYQVADTVRGLALGDFTQDWHLDVVVAGYSDDNAYDSQVQLLPNIAAPHLWSDMGFGLAGKLGVPELTGIGPLLFGTPGFLQLTFGAPSALAALFVSADANAAPFKGGTLVPIPPQIVGFVFTDPQGVIHLPWQGWPSSQPGETWYFQLGVADAAAPHGVALSNALQATEPD